MVTSEPEFTQQQQHQQQHQQHQQDWSDDDKLKTSSPTPDDADVGKKANGVFETTPPRVDSDGNVDDQLTTVHTFEDDPGRTEPGPDFVAGVDSQYYYYYYPTAQDPFGYAGDTDGVAASTYSMVAYPYAYESSCQGENGEEEQTVEEAEAGLAAAVEDGAGPAMTGGLQLPPHNDLFINPAFSYLQFLSDGSVVGPNGEIYTPANYFPAHAAATAPVDVSPLGASSPAEMPGSGVIVQSGDFGGKDLKAGVTYLLALE